VVEALVTVAVVAYLQRANQPALKLNEESAFDVETTGARRWRPLWITLAVLVVLSPIGLLAPGTAWGEWGAEEITALGFPSIPSGMAKLSTLWSAPLPDYDLSDIGNSSVAYILSAITGIIVVSIVVWLFILLATTGKKSAQPAAAGKTH